MSHAIVTPAAVYTIPDSVLADRVRVAEVRREWRKARKLLRAALDQARAYRGSPLRAEQDSRKSLSKQTLLQARQMARRAWCSRQGRRIDLAAILGDKRPDGKPVWCIADPARAIGESNGQWNYDSGKPDQIRLRIAGQWVVIAGAKRAGIGDLVPTGGIPPLPPAARVALTDPKIRKRALWVGLLYQPEGWAEAKPDPAIVVEWKDRPGEYYALVVWGPDRPRIMEFVD
jgi:hypothetical protein